MCIQNISLVTVVQGIHLSGIKIVPGEKSLNCSRKKQEEYISKNDPSKDTIQ